jgi:hypothetical protein
MLPYRGMVKQQAVGVAQYALQFLAIHFYTEIKIQKQSPT